VSGGASLSLEVVASDAAEAVVFKPSGLSSERQTAGANDGRDLSADSLIERARRQLGWPDAQLPHRLDRPTRGLLVVSRDRAVAARHSDEIRNRAWTKWYFARIPTRTVAGEALSLVGPHRAYLKREGKLAKAVRSGGDPSRLTVLAVAPATDRVGDSHALILLETGRYHQIRVMLSSLGFPLVGDTLYGGAARGHGETAIDLEAVALKIAHEGGDAVHRLASHPARVGVAWELEAKLDAAIAATA
jgi:23S rRNA-/tRNA-specific pseudouridylate synthase